MSIYPSISHRFFLGLVFALGIFGAQAPASATTITVSLPDFDGPLNTSGFPIDLGIVGTFNYAIPSGAVITGATFSGTYGTAKTNTSTAGFDVDIDGHSLTVCVDQSPDCWRRGSPFRPFSFALDSSFFSDLLDGSAELGVIQTSGNYVRLGTPTLEITFDVGTTVPEPGSLALLSLGLIGLAAARRRKGT